MKDYYQVLRISRLADQAEVKRAYRRLAVLFHPDKNKSDKALRLFQEINEAHTVLSDPIKRSTYDRILDGGGFAPQPTAPPGGWHRDPAYRRRQQQGYRPPARPGPSEKLLMMLHMLRFLKTTSWVGMFWCTFLFVDYNLPPRVNQEVILPEWNQKMSWQRRHELNVIVTNTGNHFPVPFEGVDHFKVGTEIKVVSSRMLNVLIQVESEDNLYVIDSLASIYQNLMVIPIALFVVSLGGLLMRQGIEFRFNLMVSIGILLVFNLIFLLFSIL